jgi:hypothetical protein
VCFFSLWNAVPEYSLSEVVEKIYLVVRNSFRDGDFGGASTPSLRSLLVWTRINPCWRAL